MGIVYEAHQISLERRVALKVLPTGLGLSDQAVQRFEREARAAAQLHHTNIVPVYSIGSEGGCHFYSMEMIEGPSLAQILEDVQREETRSLKEATLTRLFGGEDDDSRQSPAGLGAPTTSKSDGSTLTREWFDLVARQLADVADALEHAHERGVIHRDVKPANLLLSPEGRLCVTDFGLARVIREPGMTSTGAFLGTPAYASPEQIRGWGVDLRTDIYSLGVVLYEMLTLQRPFTGDSWEEVIHAILARDPVNPRRIHSRVPLDLETICLKAMEKEPDRRYRSAAELGGDLRLYLQRGLVTARRAGPIRRAIKLVRRHPLVSVSAAAVAAVLVVVGFAWRASLMQATESAHRAVADAQLAMNYGDYRGALAAVDEALKLDSELTDARLMRSRALVKLGRTAEAVDETRALLQKTPDDWRLHLILAGLAQTGEVPTLSAREHIELAETQAPETAEAYYLRSLVAERPREAIDLLDRALVVQPGHVDSLSERIRRYEELKDYPSALQNCELLIHVRPRSAEGRRSKEAILRGAGDLLGALAEAEQAVSLDPEDSANYASRGNANVALGRHTEAIRDITYAIRLDPDRAPYYWMRASWRNVEGEFEEAIVDAHRALELNPDYLVAYQPLLEAHYKLGRVDDARAILTELAGVSETWADAHARSRVHHAMANHSGDVGETERALKEVTRALEIDPENLGALLLRSRLRRALQDENGAEADCDAAARIVLDETREPAVRMKSPELAGTCERWRDQAMQGLDRLVEDYPDWWRLYSVRAQVNAQLGNFEAALADSNKMIELAPRLFMGYMNRQALLWKMGLPTGNDFEMALRWNPYNTTLRLNVADSAFNSGDLSRSLAESDKAIELDPLSGWAHASRGRVLAYQGRCKEAQESLSRARELHGGLALVEAQVQTVVYGCPKAYDSAAVVENARGFADRSSGDHDTWRVLGAALYHDGQYRQARGAVLKAVELAGREGAKDLLLLAVISSRLGAQSGARSYFDRALDQISEDSTATDPHLLNLLDEASTVFGASPDPTMRRAGPGERI
jgi:tetratricopeptide (TPR) repeat protein